MTPLGCLADGRLAGAQQLIKLNRFVCTKAHSQLTGTAQLWRSPALLKLLQFRSIQFELKSPTVWSRIRDAPQIACAVTKFS